MSDLTSTGSLSLALLGLLLAQPCFRVHATTEVQTDGSGTYTTEVSVDSMLMASVQTDQEADTEELRLDDDYLKKARAYADTTPGFYFDTAFQVQNPDRFGFRARLHFGSVETIGTMEFGQGGDDTAFPVLEQSGRQLRVNFRPTGLRFRIRLGEPRRAVSRQVGASHDRLPVSRPPSCRNGSGQRQSERPAIRFHSRL